MITATFFLPSLPFPQIIKSKHRLGFHGNRESIEDEFAREFPGEAYNIAQILWTVVENRKGIIDTLVKEKGMLPSFGIKAKLDSTIRRKKNTLNLQDLFQDNIKNSNCSTELKEIFSLAINYSTPLLTPHLQTAFSPSDFGNEIGFYPQGGMTGFKAHIKEKLKTFGVEIHPLSGIEKLNINKRELTGITIRGSEKQINASFLIYNSDLSVLHSLLPKNIFTKSFLEELTMKKVWGQWRTLFLLVEDDKIPVGMHSDLVIYREDKSPLIIQFLPKGNNELQGNDKRVIKVCTPMIGKKNPAESDNESIDSFEKATIEKLNELMPFLDKKIEIIYKHDNAPISKDDYIFSGSLKGPLNVGIMSPFTPFENLLIAGKEVITTLGLEGDFYSG